MAEPVDVSGAGRVRPVEPASSRWQRLRYSDNFWGWLFVLPTVIGILVFAAGPILAAFAISLTRWNIVNPPVFVGLDNYQEVVFEQELFWIALRNTLTYMVGVIPLQMSVALLIALALNQGLRYQALFRTLYFLPSVCSTVALALIWRVLFDYKLGVLNWFLDLVGLAPVPWLMRPSVAMPALIIMSAWQGIGYPMVLWLAGLQGIPQSYYDAAKVDGAGRLALFRHVTWPLLTPTTFFMLIIACINSFQVFEGTYVLTGGGPQRATYTLVFFIYEDAFRNFIMGRASAVAYVLFAFILVLTVVQLRLQKRWVNYDL
ncbi:MAG TPA: sugar ABC transporter permease [Chloroflexota bacterium]|jgi:multiple sugar transport system permease protein|nr:sugar ABC transporter permease [Chloroflexota bacterium]